MPSLPICIHADDKNRVPDVVSPINVSTTFRYDNDNLIPYTEVSGSDNNSEDQPPLYSRESHSNADRVEAVLSSILGGHSSCLCLWFISILRCTNDHQAKKAVSN